MRRFRRGKPDAIFLSSVLANKGASRYMQKIAHSVFSDEPESRDAGESAASALVDQLGGVAPKSVIVYATMNHDQQAILEGVRAGIGEGPLLIGCSVQGVVSNDSLTEDGFAL